MTTPYPQVVLFGDSLFEGCVEAEGGFSFQGALQKHCLRRYDVINRGFSGYNSSQALKILDSVFPKPTESSPKLKYLIVLYGANDAAIEMPKENQGLPLEQYKANLKAIVTHPHIKALNPDKILLVAPPPVDEIRTTELDIFYGYGKAMRLQERSARYSAAAVQAAEEVGGNVVAVDLCRALMDYAVERTEPRWDAAGEPPLGNVRGRRGYLPKLLPDGLHMSGEAYRVLFEMVKKHIEPADPSATMEGYVYPEWKVAPWNQ